MKLWMIEGLGFKVDDHDPHAILGAKLSKAGYIGDFVPFFRGRELYFTPDDSPSDVIKVVPALEASNLDNFVDPNHLPTFTGTIFYGFKTASQGEYRTTAIASFLGPLEKAVEIGGRILGGLTIDTASRMARQYRDPARWGGNKADPEKAEILEKAINIAIQVHAAYGIKTSQSSFQIGQAASLIIQRTGMNYARDAGFSLANRLKHPQPGDEKVINQFLDMCEEQLTKLPGTAIAYDYVAAPRSSGSFNKALADRVAKARGSQFLEIGKRLGKEVTVDRDQIIDRARREAPKRKTPNGKWVSKMKDPDTGKMETWEYDNEDDFVDDWSSNEYDKLQNTIVKRMPQGRDGAIKDQRYLDKRRYVKLYSDKGVEAAAGKTILLIDDNIVGGGTIELVHEILMGLNPPPRRIDIFVPLYLPTGR